MMNSQCELLDRAPPHDMETERLLLGALFVAPKKRILDADVHDFYLAENGWHGFVYMVIRKAAKKRGGEPLRDLLAQKQHARTLGVHNVARDTARLFITAAGVQVCGLVHQIPYYIATLRELRTRRERIDAATKRLQEAWKT